MKLWDNPCYEELEKLYILSQLKSAGMDVSHIKEITWDIAIAKDVEVIWDCSPAPLTQL